MVTWKEFKHEAYKMTHSEKLRNLIKVSKSSTDFLMRVGKHAGIDLRAGERVRITLTKEDYKTAKKIVRKFRELKEKAKKERHERKHKRKTHKRKTHKKKHERDEHKRKHTSKHKKKHKRKSHEKRKTHSRRKKRVEEKITINEIFYGV